MSDFDISNLWQDQQFSDETPPNDPHPLINLNIAQAFPTDFIMEHSNIEDDSCLMNKFSDPEEEQNNIFIEVEPKVIDVYECLESNGRQRVGHNDQTIQSCIEREGGMVKSEKEYFRKKGYTKNIVGYVSRKAMKLMFKHHEKEIRKKCKEKEIKFRQFQKYYKSSQKNLYGPASLLEIFKMNHDNDSQTKIKTLFQKIFTKVLRKQYLVYSLKLGKMRNIDAYIRKKNTELLYFADRVQML